MAVHVISVRRAFCLLFKELAEVITLDDGRYLVLRLRRAGARSPRPARRSKEPDDDFIRTVHFEIQVPRVIRLLDLRPAPAGQGQVQPAEHLRPRRQPLPVLRQAVPHQRAEPRPRPAPEPRRPGDLGEHRLRLRQVQRPQGGPDPGEAGMRLIQRAGPAPDQPRPRPQALQPQVPELEDVPRQRLLVGRAEMTAGRRPRRPSLGRLSEIRGRRDCFHLGDGLD